MRSEAVHFAPCLRLDEHPSTNSLTSIWDGDITAELTDSRLELIEADRSPANGPAEVPSHKHHHSSFVVEVRSHSRANVGSVHQVVEMSSQIFDEFWSLLEHVGALVCHDLDHCSTPTQFHSLRWGLSTTSGNHYKPPRMSSAERPGSGRIIL